MEDGISDTERPANLSSKAAVTKNEDDKTQDSENQNGFIDSDNHKQLPSPPASDPFSRGNQKTPPIVDTTSEPELAKESDFGQGTGNAAALMELQSTLETIGSGVQELAETMQDMLGLSDTQSSDSDDSFDSYGEQRFSFARLRTRARKRRKRRQQWRPAVETDETLKPRGVVPEVQECDFERFKSRPAGNEHKVHCVDVLLAGDTLEDDIGNFEVAVAKAQRNKSKTWVPDLGPKRTEHSSSETSGKRWVRRIRINSTVVMKILHHVCKEDDRFGNKPMVFYRPFQLLVFRQDDMKEQLAKMKRLACGDIDERTIEDFTTRVESSTAEDQDWDDELQKLCEDEHAIAEMECFINFMEEKIIPDSKRYENLTSPQAATVRYEDLWYLLKPGNLVYVPRDKSSKDILRKSPSAQSIFRLFRMKLEGPSKSSSYKWWHDKVWSLDCYYLEYDGASFGPVKVEIQISPFRGESKVAELQVYPVGYLQDSQIMAQAQSDGAAFVSIIERRFGFYSGWTQTTDPSGHLTRDPSGARQNGPSHIESDVLVDYHETFTAFPAWKPRFHSEEWKERPTPNDIDREDHDILEWDEEGKTNESKPDWYISWDGTPWVEMRKLLKNEPYGLFTGDERKVPKGRDLALLPKRFFAYAVVESSFIQLNIRSLRSADLEAGDRAFEKLQINQEYKMLILAVVKSHFDKIQTERETNVEIETQDLIRGKGKGLVILLHGPPGVGKTATAEAVALKWKKPLYPITCGELGFTAELLEKSLNNIFRLAHQWGCILLLDEADVFITRREINDLQRNALVSAFLRVLEYYNGILFLTTNRPGVLDDAVKSRVHLNLHYDHLDLDRTVAIFKQNIQRLREIEKQRNPDPNKQVVILHKEIIQFAKDHFHQRHEHNISGKWNGRQIRNAFLIASSLAHYQDEYEERDGDMEDLANPNIKVQKQMGRKHFEIVAQTTLLYDQYQARIHSGKSEDHVALEREERATTVRRPRTPDRLKGL